MGQDESERYMLIVEEDGASSSPGMDLPRPDAWELAREIRERGVKVSIVRVTGDDVECVVADDQPLHDMLD